MWTNLCYCENSYIPGEFRYVKCIRLRLKCDGTRAETRFCLSAKRTSPFESLIDYWQPMCASAVVMLDTPCSEVVWRVLASHSVCQFPLHFPSHASPCAITFQLDSTPVCTSWRYWFATISCRNCIFSMHIMQKHANLQWDISCCNKWCLQMQQAAYCIVWGGMLLSPLHNVISRPTGSDQWWGWDYSMGPVWV